MEGVVVSAKRPGSTVMVSVSTDAQGQYSFPQDRLAPSAYDITIRAVGYTLKPTTATIGTGGSTQLDLALAKAAPAALALQLSNSEWMQSAPGTPAQKIALLSCLDCHGLQRPFFSKDNASEMAITVQRMRGLGQPPGRGSPGRGLPALSRPPAGHRRGLPLGPGGAARRPRQARRRGDPDHHRRAGTGAQHRQAHARRRYRHHGRRPPPRS